MDFQQLINDYGPLVILVAMFVIVFVVPNIRQQKSRQKMLQSLEEGQRIVTIGGIFAEIVELKREYMIVKVLDTEVYLTMVRSAVKKVINSKERENGD